MTNNVPYNAHCKEYGEAINQCPSLEDVTERFLEEERKNDPRGTFYPPYRMLCVTSQFLEDWKRVLPGIIPATEGDCARNQAIDLLAGYCKGRVLEVPHDIHPTIPEHCFCWEMKTNDVRIYGWYVVQNFFIAAKLSDANKTHGNEGYKEVFDAMLNIKKIRGGLLVPLDSFVSGKRIGHVLSNRIG